MGDLALLHSHRLYGKGRQSLWNLARQRKGAPSCSGAPWGEERGAWAVRPVYPDTPLQVKAPEGQDTLEEERGSPRLRGELVGTQTDGAGLGWASPKGPQGPISLLCFAVWTVVGLAAWFRDGCCSDQPLQEYQAIQQGSYPCPGTQAGPPGVIGTESPSPHCPPPADPHSTAPTNEEPAWVRGPSSPSNRGLRKSPSTSCHFWEKPEVRKLP